MNVLKTIIPGPLTTIQDCGRVGFGRYGVAPSGAVDAYSLRVANCLVGNTENQAGLEITIMGPVLEALQPVAIAITGADMQAKINGRSVPSWKTLVMKKGERLSFAGLKNGLRSYLAVGGGICVEIILGSRSTNLSAGFGGLSGRPLVKGDILSAHLPNTHLKNEGKTFNKVPIYSAEQTLRIIYGPQSDHFEKSALTLFEKGLYQVSEKSDRTGIRLKGPAVPAKAGRPESIISEGLISGVIQIPGDNQPIIILSETVTGGYRKIATIISADLHLLGQLRPGNRVRFLPVSHGEAEKSLKDQESIISNICFKDANETPCEKS